MGTNPFIKHIGLHTSGQDIDTPYFCKLSASILLDKILILFTFAKYQPGQDIDSFYFCKISASILLDKIRLPQVRYTTKVTPFVNFWRKLYSKSLFP